MTHRRIAAALGAAGLLVPAVAAFPVAAKPPAAGLAPQNCLHELATGRGPEIVCQYPAWLADQERNDLRRITREMLQDARCMVSIRIDRRVVEEALRQPDHVFVAPAQPVTCEIVTKDSSFPITGTFAPKVVFKAGRAVEGSPNLANVQGVNRYLAWPVVQYVNSSSYIRGEMLRMINLYRDRLMAAAPAR